MPVQKTEVANGHPQCQRSQSDDDCQEDNGELHRIHPDADISESWERFNGADCRHVSLIESQ